MMFVYILKVKGYTQKRTIYFVLCSVMKIRLLCFLKFLFYCF